MIKHALTEGSICEIMHGLRNKKEVNMVSLATGASRERLTTVGRAHLASYTTFMPMDTQGRDD